MSFFIIFFDLYTYICMYVCDWAYYTIPWLPCLRICTDTLALLCFFQPIQGLFVINTIAMRWPSKIERRFVAISGAHIHINFLFLLFWNVRFHKIQKFPIFCPPTAIKLFALSRFVDFRQLVTFAPRLHCSALSYCRSLSGRPCFAMLCCVPCMRSFYILLPAKRKQNKNRIGSCKSNSESEMIISLIHLCDDEVRIRRWPQFFSLPLLFSPHIRSFTYSLTFLPQSSIFPLTHPCQTD